MPSAVGPLTISIVLFPAGSAIVVVYVCTVPFGTGVSFATRDRTPPCVENTESWLKELLATTLSNQLIVIATLAVVATKREFPLKVGFTPTAVLIRETSVMFARDAANVVGVNAPPAKSARLIPRAPKRLGYR